MIAILKFGEYLAGHLPGNQGSVDHLLNIQREGALLGKHERLGELAVEAGLIDASTLESCLKRQREDLIGAVDFFSALKPQWKSRIAALSRHVTHQTGSLIFRESARGDAFYILTSGQARVFRTSEDGVEVTLTLLGPGDGFGELSLLTGEPRAASVAAVETTHLLCVPKPAFDELIQNNPELAMAFVRILADWLNRGDRKIVDASARERAYQRFAAERTGQVEKRLIGKSRALTELLGQIRLAADEFDPVLIQGETGTEKLEAAWLVHQGGSRPGAPFFWMDAQSVTLDPARDEKAAADGLHAEVSQHSTLFGHLRHVLPSSPDARLGLLQIAHSGTVVIENVECLAPNVQAHLVEYLGHGKFSPLGSDSPLATTVRVMATTSRDLSTLAAAGQFNPELHRHLTGHVIKVPTLRERKKDLRHILQTLVVRHSDRLGRNVRDVSENAYKAIMAYDWPGNSEELDVVIRRAVSVAQGEELAPEDIFLGTPPITGRYTFNLLRLDGFRSLFMSRAWPAGAQAVTGVFISLIVYLGLRNPEEPGPSLATSLTWGLWEPMVVLSALFAARIWCAACPIRGVSTAFQKIAGAGRNVPLLLRKHGHLFAAFGIGLIFWAESAAGMLSSARATAILVLTVTVYALSAALIFKRMAWCRYLCPLGGMVGFLSGCSAIEMRANYNICCNDCGKPDCFVGNEKADGCPMLEGPFSLRSNQDCTLCGQCIKICEKKSPVLNLRIPGYELWTTSRPDPRVAAFGIAVLGTQVFRGMEGAGFFTGVHEAGSLIWWGWSAALMTVLTGLAWLYVRLSGLSLMQGVKIGSRMKAHYALYAMIPLIAAFELAWQSGRLLALAGLIPAQAAAEAGLALDLPSISTPSIVVKTVAALLIVTGLAASRALERNLLRQHRPSEQADGISHFFRWPIPVLCLAFLTLLILAP